MSVWFRCSFCYFPTLIAAGDSYVLEWVVCSQGPLNNLSFSTVRIMSLFEVISIISVVACKSMKVCVCFFDFFLACFRCVCVISFDCFVRRFYILWYRVVWGSFASLCSGGSITRGDVIGPACVRQVCEVAFFASDKSLVFCRWVIPSRGGWGMRPVHSCPCACAGLSAIFWPCRCRCCVLSMGLKSVSFHVRGVITLSLGCTLCAIRQTSSQASRCLSRIG